MIVIHMYVTNLKYFFRQNNFKVLLYQNLDGYIYIIHASS